MFDEIIYPEGVETTDEQREFDTFLLSYISAEAVRKRSPKVKIDIEALETAWQEHLQAKKKPH